MKKLLEQLGTTGREREAYFEGPFDSFQGSRLGFVYKLGIKGLGYYEDLFGTKMAAMAMVNRGKEREQQQAGGSSSSSSSSSSAANAGAGAGTGGDVDDEAIELVDLDADDVAVVEDPVN